MYILICQIYSGCARVKLHNNHWEAQGWHSVLLLIQAVHHHQASAGLRGPASAQDPVRPGPDQRHDHPHRHRPAHAAQHQAPGGGDRVPGQAAQLPGLPGASSGGQRLRRGLRGRLLRPRHTRLCRLQRLQHPRLHRAARLHWPERGWLRGQGPVPRDHRSAPALPRARASALLPGQRLRAAIPRVTAAGHHQHRDPGSDPGPGIPLRALQLSILRRSRHRAHHRHRSGFCGRLSHPQHSQRHSNFANSTANTTTALQPRDSGVAK